MSDIKSIKMISVCNCDHVLIHVTFLEFTGTNTPRNSLWLSGGYCGFYRLCFDLFLFFGRLVFLVFYVLFAVSATVNFLIFSKLLNCYLRWKLLLP